MPGSPSKQIVVPDLPTVAEQLRAVLSRWIRTTREQAGTPSTAKLETLRSLQEQGPATIATLAQRRAVKHQSMRLVIEQLVAGGQVRKTADSADRRTQVVSITEKGRSTLKEEQRVRVMWIAQLLHGCTAEEVNQVMLAVNTLEGLLKKSVTMSI